MQELKAGVTDAAVEKHVPVYTVEGSHVHVVVGETKHPMLEEHFIEWITPIREYTENSKSRAGAGSRFLSLRW